MDSPPPAYRRPWEIYRHSARYLVCILACVCTVRRPLGVTSGFLLLDWRCGDRQEMHRECMYVRMYVCAVSPAFTRAFVFVLSDCIVGICVAELDVLHVHHSKWILRIFLVHHIQFAIKFGDCDRFSSNF